MNDEMKDELQKADASEIEKVLKSWANADPAKSFKERDAHQVDVLLGAAIRRKHGKDMPELLRKLRGVLG
jgi:hypothetical protein